MGDTLISDFVQPLVFAADISSYEGIGDVLSYIDFILHVTFLRKLSHQQKLNYMKKIILYTVFALFLPLLYWLLLYLIHQGVFDMDPESGWLGLIRGYTPTFAAIITIWLLREKSGLKSYWRHLFQFRAPAKHYLLVIFFPLILNALDLLILSFFDRITFELINPVRFIALYVIFIFVDGPLGEEMGWRGFYLPALLKKFHPLLATLFLGIVLFLWHIPLYAADGRDLTLVFLSKYLISVLAHTVFFTYFYLRFNSKTVFAVLLHTSLNYFIFLRNSLAPSVREITWDNNIYIMISCTIATVLAYSMYKTHRYWISG